MSDEHEQSGYVNSIFWIEGKMIEDPEVEMYQLVLVGGETRACPWKVWRSSDLYNLSLSSANLLEKNGKISKISLIFSSFAGTF